MEEYLRKLISFFGVPSISCVIYMFTVREKYSWMPFEEQVIILFAIMGLGFFALHGLELGVLFFQKDNSI